jgi:hypothetical protein
VDKRVLFFSFELASAEVFKDLEFCEEVVIGKHHSWYDTVSSFVDNESEKVVKTTIWAKTEHQVLLKGGRRIPINRITRVGMVG